MSTSSPFQNFAQQHAASKPNWDIFKIDGSCAKFSLPPSSTPPPPCIQSQTPSTRRCGILATRTNQSKHGIGTYWHCPGCKQKGRPMGLKATSQDLLASALKTLLSSDRSLDDIRVEHILKLSGVSRATFYKYFYSKYELARYVFLNELANVSFFDYNRPLEEREVEILRHLDANRAFYRNALASQEFRDAWMQAAYKADAECLKGHKPPGRSLRVRQEYLRTDWRRHDRYHRHTHQRLQLRQVGIPALFHPQDTLIFQRRSPRNTGLLRRGFGLAKLAKLANACERGSAAGS